MTDVAQAADRRYWQWIDLPEGPHPVPRWAGDIHIDWMMGYGNAPDIRIKADHNVTDWPDKRWIRNGPRFMAEHPDGRATIHWHDGTIRLTTMKRRVRTGRLEWHDEEYEALATTQQEGYAGRHFSVVIGGKDSLRGKTVILRGPWHHGAPAGLVACSFVDMAYAAKYRRTARKLKPWHRELGFFGLFLQEQTFMRILARFAPHVRLARIVEGERRRLEIVHPDWSAPKAFMPAAERDAHWLTGRYGAIPDYVTKRAAAGKHNIDTAPPAAAEAA